jgi:hypothetical protein
VQKLGMDGGSMPKSVIRGQVDEIPSPLLVHTCPAATTASPRGGDQEENSQKVNGPAGGPHHHHRRRFPIEGGCVGWDRPFFGDRANLRIRQRSRKSF